MKDIELLIPVGDFDCLVAAVQNGADTVYFGSSLFNARQSATNFDIDELEKAIDYAKLRNVKTNLTLNTLIKDNEFEDAVNIAKKAYEFGIDAIIVQDLGLATYLIKHFPDLPIHASTQMTVHNLEGVKQLEDLGFKRAVLSRELSADEIEYICKNSKIEIEAFIHGALCISYSGQCLLSSSIGGRSGNRGKCAQPCRLPYELLNSTNKTINKGHLLSPKDLCGIDYLPQLVNSGIKCLKIEGRLKSPEYVAIITRIYRKYLDMALNNIPYTLSDDDKKQLMQVFNRGGFSNGHLSKNPNTDLIYKQKPNHMGLPLGTIISYNPKKGYIKLKLENIISLGDSIQVEKENNNYNVSELLLNNSNIKTSKIGDIVEIGRLKGNISVGDKVFKTVDKELFIEARKSFSGTEYKKIPIEGNINIKQNLPILLNVSCNFGIYKGANITINSNIVPQLAENSPITKDRIISQLNKTGNTQFEFSNITTELDDNLFIPATCLNELRRTALEKLEEFAKENYKRNFLNDNKSTHLYNLLNITRVPKYCILLNNLDLTENYSNLDIDYLYIPFKYFIDSNYEHLLNQLGNLYNLYIYMPTIIRNNYLKHINDLDNILNNYKIQGFVISHISQLKFVEKYNKKIIGNYTLNVMNLHTASFLHKLKLDTITISPELDKSTITDMLESYDKINFELIVYGKLPLMTSNYCLIGNTNHCLNSCIKNCKKENYYLKDRLGFLFKIAPDDIDTITTIYNSKTTSISPIGFNLNSIRMDFLDESIDEIKNVIKTVKSGNRLEGKDYTNGNLNKLI